MTIPFSPPDITLLEQQGLLEVLNSGWLTTGPKTKELEQKITQWCRSAGTVCLNSGTAALELSLRLLGVGPGDEVITTPYTYTATASAVCHTGAQLVLADTAPGSYEMDWQQAAAKISRRTKAIIVVDIGGVPCHYSQWLALAEEKQKLFSPSTALQSYLGRVAIVADAAHSFGSQYQGAASGAIADFTAFSFHAVKNLTTGEGGALTWRRGLPAQQLYRQGQILSLHGQTKDALAKTRAGSWEYDILTPGWKWNMTDLAAALGLAQLERYPNMLASRRRCLGVYRSILQGLPVTMLEHPTGETASNCHLNMVRILGCGPAQRNEVIRHMAEKGVAANVHYKPLPLLTAYRNMGFSPKDFPNACRQYENEVTLPLFSSMTQEQAQYAAEVFCQAVGEVAALR